jgi:hypothetical protein
MSRHNWVSIDAKATVRISDIEDLQGEIPEPFKKCLIPACGRDTVYIICALVDDPRLREDRALAAAAVAQLSSLSKQVLQ